MISWPVMEVYREILPDSYLLILTDNPAPHPAEVAALRQALRRAGASGKTNIWVDCSQLQHLPEQALRLLCDFYLRFQHQHVNLVLCHLDDDSQHTIQELPMPAQPPVVDTLLEAARYCRSQRRFGQLHQHPVRLATERRLSY